VSNTYDFEELPPGRYEGIVERVLFDIRTTTSISIIYKLDTPGGVRRVKETIPINAPKSSVNYYYTTMGLRRVEDILQTQKQPLPAHSLRDLPKLLEGLAIAVVIGHRRMAGYNVPVVMWIEAV
jgi:hypothetical protein